MPRDAKAQLHQLIVQPCSFRKSFCLVSWNLVLDDLQG